MPNLRDKWLRQMEQALEAVSKLEPNDLNRLKVLPPASREEIVAVETALGRKLPDDLVWFFSEISAGVDFYWSLLLTDLPEELRNVLTGQFRFSLAGLRTDLLNWSGWEDLFLHPEDYDVAALEYAFEQVFPLLSDMGGDMVILVTDGPHRGNVVYLNHEGESFDRAVLGPTLQEFPGHLDRAGMPRAGLRSLEGLLRHRGATALQGRRRGAAVEKLPGLVSAPSFGIPTSKDQCRLGEENPFRCSSSPPPCADSRSCAP